MLNYVNVKHCYFILYYFYLVPLTNVETFIRNLVLPRVNNLIFRENSRVIFILNETWSWYVVQLLLRIGSSWEDVPKKGNELCLSYFSKVAVDSFIRSLNRSENRGQTCSLIKQSEYGIVHSTRYRSHKIEFIIDLSRQ